MKVFKCVPHEPPKDHCPPPPPKPCPPPPPADHCPPEPCKPMSNNTTNNYHYSDSHNTTVTTTNNYSTSDSHNTSNVITTNNNYSYDSHNTTTTTNTTSTDSHDTDVNVSLVDGGVLNGSLNNVLNVLSGNSILNTGDILTGDILTGDNTILSPTVAIGDIDVVVSDLVNNVLKPTTNVGDVLSPSIGDVLSNIELGDVKILPIAGDVLSDIDVVGISKVSTTVAPVVGNVLSDLVDAKVLNDVVDAKVLNDVVDLTKVLNFDASVLNDVVDAKVLGIVPVAAEILSEVGNGNLDHITTEIAPTVGDVASKLGVVANVGDVLEASVGDVIAKIGSFDLVDAWAPVNISEIVQGASAEIIGTIVSGVGGGFSAALLNHAGSVDLSDVGALVTASASHAIEALNLDLDQLTSKVDLFDIGHFDSLLSGHHA